MGVKPARLAARFQDAHADQPTALWGATWCRHVAARDECWRQSTL